MVTATSDILQWYFVVCVEFIVFRACVDIVQYYCVVCGVFSGYSNSRYSAMVLCRLWSFLCLQQQ